MASTDGRPVPIRAVAFRVTFPILDADGDLVTGATTPDSEVSKDGGTFADCTNEITEIATASGMYFLDLTSTEMTADTVAVIIKSATAGAKTTPLVLYPEEAGDINVDVTSWNGTAVATPATAGIAEVNVKNFNNLAAVALPLVPTVAGRTLDVSAAGEAGIDWANIGGPTTAQNLSATNIDVDQVVASVSGAVGSVAAGGITATSIAADAIGASELAADAVTEIANAVWDMDATGHQTLGTFGQAIGDPVADTNTIFKAVVTDATGATVGVDVVAMKVDTAAILVDTGTTLDAALAVVDANVDAILVDTGITLQGEVDAIQADVAAILVDTGTTLDGRIPAALVGGRMDSSVGAMAANVLTATAINADAITAAKVADGTIDAATFAAGAINAAAIAADAITAAKIAPDAIGASELAADAVTEIQAGLATAAGLTTRADAIDAALVTIDDFVDTEVGAVVGFVDNLEARITQGLTDKLAAHAAAVLVLVVGAGSTTTAVKLGTVDGAAPSAVNDFYNSRVIVFTSGALAGQATAITDYVGATTTATVVALTAAPADTVVGVIV